MAKWNTLDKLRTVDLGVPEQSDPVIIVAADDMGASTMAEMSKEEAFRLAFELMRAAFIREEKNDDEDGF